MAEINTFTQEQLAEQINTQFRTLSEFLQEQHEAYKLLYDINGKFIEYCEHARILAQSAQPNVSLGGY